MPIPSSSARNAQGQVECAGFAPVTAPSSAGPPPEQEWYRRGYAPLSLNTETKALSHNLPLFEPVGADTSRPQRRGIEPSVEWILPKVSEFVGGGNLSPRNVTEQSGMLNVTSRRPPPKLPLGEAGRP